MLLTQSIQFIGIAILFLSLTTSSCTRIAFEEPQPEGVEQLHTFPKTMRGAYAHSNAPGDTAGIVEAERIIGVEATSHTIDLAHLDTMPYLTLTDEMVFDSRLPQNRGWEYEIIDSTLNYTTISYDTLGISDTIVIKQWDQYLVLNTRFEDDLWDVYLLELLKDGGLQSYAIANYRPHNDTTSLDDFDGDITQFFNITEFEQTSESEYIIRPSQKELKQLLDAGLFKKEDVFVKLD